MANEPVKLIECPRDAWQGLPRQIPTRLKAEYLHQSYRETGVPARSVLWNRNI